MTVNCDPVFVVGVGRSGTHFMARVLGSHDMLDDLTGGRENPQVFGDVTRAARKNHILYPKVVRQYEDMVKMAYPKRFFDQSHPNLWNYEYLVESFSGSKFIAMVRDPLSVVYSSLNHKVVKSWAQRSLHDNPLPNRFLGIFPEFYSRYSEMTVSSKLAMRWASHVYRINQLYRSFPEAVLPVFYEDLILNSDNVLKRISAHLDVSNSFSVGKIRKESLLKKSLLSSEDVECIISVINEFFSYYPLVGGGVDVQHYLKN